MAFNKISLLSVEDINVSQLNIQYIQDSPSSTTASNARDIFYHLGTDLGQTSWSNPASGSYLNITENQALGTQNNIVDRNINVTYRANPASLPIIITFQFLTGFEVDLQAFRYYTTSSTSYILDTFTWEGSNDGTNWEVIYNANELWEQNSSANVWHYEPILDNRPGYFSWLRLNITEIRSGNVFDLAELEIYGKLRNLTTGVAGFKTPGDRFDNLLNVDTYNPRNNREITYDATDNVWESRINQPWTVINEVMTGDITLTRDDLRNPRFYILSPNGATRNVTLPAPEVNDAIKFRNLDGSFDINIFEDGNPTPVVLSNSGKLQYEYVYDGTEWHVIG